MPARHPQRGLLLIDRHLEKNGGTTFRAVLQNAELNGQCLFWGFKQTSTTWRAVMERMGTYVIDEANCTRPAIGTSNPAAQANSITSPDGNAASQHGCKSVDMPRICIEAHTYIDWGMPWIERFDQVLSLRSRMAQRRIPFDVVLTVRIREPLSFYLSFYIWIVVDRQMKNSKMGRTFAEWVLSTPNLQSELMISSLVAQTASFAALDHPERHALAARWGMNLTTLRAAMSTDLSLGKNARVGDRGLRALERKRQDLAGKRGHFAGKRGDLAGERVRSGRRLQDKSFDAGASEQRVKETAPASRAAGSEGRARRFERGRGEGRGSGKLRQGVSAEAAADGAEGGGRPADGGGGGHGDDDRVDAVVKYSDLFAATSGDADRRLRTILRMLDEFDVAGTTERFDETSALLMHTLKWDAAIAARTEYEAPTCATSFVGNRLPWYCIDRRKEAPPYSTERRRIRARICPDMEACARLVRSVAAADHALYARAQQRLKDDIAAAGAPFQATMQAFHEYKRRNATYWGLRKCSWVHRPRGPRTSPPLPPPPPPPPLRLHELGRNRRRDRSPPRYVPPPPQDFSARHSCIRGDQEVLGRVWYERSASGEGKPHRIVRDLVKGVSPAFRTGPSFSWLRKLAHFALNKSAWPAGRAHTPPAGRAHTPPHRSLPHAAQVRTQGRVQLPRKGNSTAHFARLSARRAAPIGGDETGANETEPAGIVRIVY